MSIHLHTVFMENNILIREYQADDKNHILELLQLNTPSYFSADEEKDLIYYLDNEIEHYFVIEYDDALVGCGGFNFSGDESTAKISWDIIHPQFQGKSLGRRLLEYRLDQLKRFHHPKVITVRTSQLAYQFYEKSGFKLIEVKKDYWADGFHLYKMQYSEAHNLS